MELPKEDNPFLGNSALRLCFSNSEMFRNQLRASTYGNLWLMLLPMVGSLDDVRRAKAVIESVKFELKSEETEYSDSVKLGIMIEIPSIAFIADLVVKEVDFASIGTNDLCQYLCAVDRLNPSVSGYYQSYHPAMFRAMRFAIKQFVKADKPICVCGELGGDPFVAPVLIGLGMRKLSMNISAIASIKRVLSTLTIAEMEVMADIVCNLKTAADVEDYLASKIKIL
jgi:phosphotransferase system enzyme I (PtsI)